MCLCGHLKQFHIELRSVHMFFFSNPEVRGRPQLPCRRLIRFLKASTYSLARWKMLLANWKPWLTLNRPSPKGSMQPRSVLYICVWIPNVLVYFYNEGFLNVSWSRTGSLTLMEVQRERRTSGLCSLRPKRLQTCVRIPKKEMTFCGLLERSLRWLPNSLISEDSK